MSKLVIKDKLLYSLADKKYYETMTRYVAYPGDFCVGLQRRLPADWVLHRRELWTHCNPPEANYPDQGWKIHLSATLAHAPAILTTVATILIEAGVPFKFVADRMLLGLSLGKRWARGAAGKFIAIYPRDPQQCGDLLEKLHQATIGFNGPFILSDRRYKDSRVVYYRYGGLRGTRRVAHDGSTTLVITDQDGKYVEDERTPYFQLPAGIQDPFIDKSLVEPEGEPGTLKNGRYHIQSVLVFSNPGGVYLATDRQSGATVIIKEARPFTNISSRGLDAVQLLKKEHRILTCLADTGISPKPIDFFFDWEHAYMVEEYFEGVRDFRMFMANFSLSLRTRPAQSDSQSFFERYCKILGQLAKIVELLHERHIVFGDLSMANIVIKNIPDSDEVLVRLIDFEGAHEANVDIPAHLFTPGFSPDTFAEKGVTEREDDLYALGSLMLAGLFPMNQLLVLDRGAGKRFMDAISRDFGLPLPIHDMIEKLMSRRELRPTPAQVSAVLEAPYAIPAPVIGSVEFDELDAPRLLGDIMRYIDSTADFSRFDRLYPADPEVFTTNPLSLAFGACGVAMVQKKVRGTVSQEVLDWIKRVPLRRDAFSPGLYSGLGGIAWFWLEMGEEQLAKQALAHANDHPYLTRCADVFHGAAGWGMTQLRFYRHLGDRVYLDAAISAGEQLLASREQDGEGQCCWRTPDGLSAGYAHGAAGICTFLLYLYMATDRREFITAGEQGLAWIMHHGHTNKDGGLSWVVEEGSATVTPYWRWGSSGIARVFLRYWHITGNEAYASLIDEVIVDCDRKYAIFPGYFFGLAGIGELFLDLARFDRWRDVALGGVRRLLAGCTLYALPFEEGVAFPGESLSRITCDLGTGGAGVALVLHRYLTRCGASMMLDDMLPGWSVEDR